MARACDECGAAMVRLRAFASLVGWNTVEVCIRDLRAAARARKTEGANP